MGNSVTRKPILSRIDHELVVKVFCLVSENIFYFKFLKNLLRLFKTLFLKFSKKEAMMLGVHLSIKKSPLLPTFLLYFRGQFVTIRPQRRKAPILTFQIQMNLALLKILSSLEKLISRYTCKKMIADYGSS